MKVAYLSAVILIMLISFLGVIGEREDIKLRDHLTALTIVSMISFIVSVKWL